MAKFHRIPTHVGHFGGRVVLSCSVYSLKLPHVWLVMVQLSDSGWIIGQIDLCDINSIFFTKDQGITLKKAVDICCNEEIYNLFHLPLSLIASD
jgi:hypothetical protein